MLASARARDRRATRRAGSWLALAGRGADCPDGQLVVQPNDDDHHAEGDDEPSEANAESEEDLAPCLGLNALPVRSAPPNLGPPDPVEVVTVACPAAGLGEEHTEPDGEQALADGARRHVCERRAPLRCLALL